MDSGKLGRDAPSHDGIFAAGSLSSGATTMRKGDNVRIGVTTVIGLLALGGAIGAVSGIGGGLLVIPALVFFFGLTHTQAVGTSLGMLLPPIGIFAFLTYYRVRHPFQ